MELLTPSIGLIIWQILFLAAIVLFIVAWIKIVTSKTMSYNSKILWMFGTLVLPLIGPIVFLSSGHSRKSSD